MWSDTPQAHYTGAELGLPLELPDAVWTMLETRKSGAGC